MIFATIDWGSILDQTIQQAFGIEAIAFALAAIGLNVHFGYTGLLNFGQVGFMLVGAYGVGLGMIWGLHPVLALLVGIGFGLVLAILLGIPTLRLRSDYLAIVTIAAAEIVRLLGRSTWARPVTRGAEGLNEWAGPFQDFGARFFERSVVYGFGPLSFRGAQAYVVFFGWIAVLLATLMIWQLMRSPWGRVVKAIREDEDAARALGKNAYWYKLQALMLGGALGAMGGMVRGIGNATVQPDTFAAPITFFVWTALIIGGVGKVWAPVAGAIIFNGLFAFIDNMLRQMVGEGIIPSTVMDSIQVGPVRFMLVGLALALLMVFRPQGLFGNREEMALDDR